MNNKPFPYLMIQTPPTSEPISIDEAKIYLRVDSNDEDLLIRDMIVTARQAAEKYIKRSLMTQTWLLTFDTYAPTEALLPKGPVQSITSVTIVNRDATESVLPATAYYLNAGKEMIVFDTPAIGHIIEILYVTGYGNADQVPHDIKQGMLAHISDLYDKRSESVGMPESSKNLYSPYRVVCL